MRDVVKSNAVSHWLEWFYTCAQPMRDVVTACAQPMRDVFTKEHRLSLAGRQSRISTEYVSHITSIKHNAAWSMRSCDTLQCCHMHPGHISNSIWPQALTSGCWYQQTLGCFRLLCSKCFLLKSVHFWEWYFMECRLRIGFSFVVI